jgi:cell wall-associated NlpC family hydrolase
MNAVAIARSFIGTPYHHQARRPGVGLDCLGVLICVARALGHVAADGNKLLQHLRDHLTEIPFAQMSPGDYVCIAYDRYPHHVGVVGDYHLGGLSLIHADSKTRRVEECRLVFNESMRFVAAFRKGGA